MAARKCAAVVEINVASFFGRPIAASHGGPHRVESGNAMRYTITGAVMFKETKPYRRETISSISGEDRGIEIAFAGYPIRVLDDGSEARAEYYPDFNSKLMDAIWTAIGDYVSFSRRALEQSVRLDVKVSDAPVFQVEIRMKTTKTKREFTGDLPDAVISALKSENIGR
jgi:hypothetical protein